MIGVTSVDYAQTSLYGLRFRQSQMSGANVTNNIVSFDGGVVTVLPRATERSNVEVNAFVFGQMRIQLKCLSTLGENTGKLRFAD